LLGVAALKQNAGKKMSKQTKLQKSRFPVLRIRLTPNNSALPKNKKFAYFITFLPRYGTLSKALHANTW